MLTLYHLYMWIMQVQLLQNKRLFNILALSLDKTNCSTWAAEYRMTPLISTPFKQLAKAKQKQSIIASQHASAPPYPGGWGSYVRLGRRILIRPHCSAAEPNNSWSHCVVTQFATRFLHCNEFFGVGHRRRDTTIKFAVEKTKALSESRHVFFWIEWSLSWRSPWVYVL